jgi:hypothetical protein
MKLLAVINEDLIASLRNASAVLLQTTQNCDVPLIDDLPAKFLYVWGTRGLFLVGPTLLRDSARGNEQA